jgi:hypothetical protein
MPRTGIKAGGCFLVCAVEFPVDVSKCSATVSPTQIGEGGAVGGSAETIATSNVKQVVVAMYDKTGNLTAQNFAVTVVCPASS